MNFKIDGQFESDERSFTVVRDDIVRCLTTICLLYEKSVVTCGHLPVGTRTARGRTEFHT